MALASTGVWEIRIQGSDQNGGYFNPASGGTDYSQQDTAQLSLSDVVTNGTTTVTSATGGFTAAMAGNGFNVAGTVYEITAVGSPTSVTVDRAAANGTGQAGKVGGACGSPGYVAGQRVGGNAAWLKGTTANGSTQAVYAITTATVNVAGGCVQMSGKDGSNATMTRTEGYGSVRGDQGTQPVLQLATGLSSATIWNANHSNEQVVNLSFDGNGTAGSTGLSLNNGNGLSVTRCRAANCKSAGFYTGSASAVRLSYCEATGCTIGFTGSGGTFLGCYAHANTSHGFQQVAAVWLFGCIAAANGGSGFNVPGSYNYLLVGCVAYGNMSDGFTVTNDGVGTTFTNCVAYGNGGVGYNVSAVLDGLTLYSSAGGGNSGGNYSAANVRRVYNFIALAANPFNNPSAGDFSLNTTAGGGALLRGAGIPGVFPGGLTVGFPDVGAVQSKVGTTYARDLFGKLIDPLALVGD